MGRGVAILGGHRAMSKPPGTARPPRPPGRGMAKGPAFALTRGVLILFLVPGRGYGRGASRIVDEPSSG